MFAILKAIPAGYLDIKEWRIKIKLEDVSKLTYVINRTPNSSPNSDSYISDVEFNNAVNTSDKCKLLGIHPAQLSPVSDNTPKIGKYYSFKEFLAQTIQSRAVTTVQTR